MFPFRPFFSGRSRRREFSAFLSRRAFFFCSSPSKTPLVGSFHFETKIQLFLIGVQSTVRFEVRCKWMRGWMEGRVVCEIARALRGSQVKNYSVFGTSLFIMRTPSRSSSTADSTLIMTRASSLATSPWSAERIIPALFYV